MIIHLKKLEIIMRNVANLDRQGKTDQALDELQDLLDDVIRNKKFKLLDKMLKKHSPSEFSLPVLTEIISSTEQIKLHLSYRKRFFEKSIIIDTQLIGFK